MQPIINLLRPPVIFIAVILLVCFFNASNANEIEDIVKNSIKNQYTPSDVMMQDIHKLVEQLDTPEWESSQEELRSSIAKSMDIDINSSEIGDARDNLNNDFSERRLVVFISESVPMPVLRAYARSLHKVDGVMVLRGMKGGMGKVAPTMRFVAEIIKTDALCKNKACPSYDVPIFIDPILYAQYAIKRVPAVTLIKNKSLQQHCDYQKEIVDVNKTVSLGDASLLTHLAYLESQFRKEDVKSFIYELEGRNEL